MAGSRPSVDPRGCRGRYRADFENRENQKAPTVYRPANRSNNDAPFIVLQERDDFCGVRVVPIGKLLEKNTAGRQVGSGQCSTAECPLLGAGSIGQRNTLIF
jgi:hypothetical protein